MRISVGNCNGTKVVPLTEVEKIVHELEAYKMAYKNLQTIVNIYMESEGGKGVSKNAE